jgi:hypothetical protein
VYWKISASITTDSRIVCSTWLLFCEVTRPLMKLNKQTTVKTKCHDNRLQNRSSLPIFFLPTGTPGHRIRFPQSGNFLEGGDAVSRFFKHCVVSPSSFSPWPWAWKGLQQLDSLPPEAEESDVEHLPDKRRSDLAVGIDGLRNATFYKIAER